MKNETNLLNLDHPRVGSMNGRVDVWDAADSNDDILDLGEDRCMFPRERRGGSVFEEGDENGFGNVSTLLERGKEGEGIGEV